MTSPDPVPPPSGPLAAIVTTEGTTCSATETTGQALAVDEDTDEVPEVAVEPDDCVAPTMRPPATPPTTSAAPSATHSSHRRGLRGCLDSLIAAPYPDTEAQRLLGKDTWPAHYRTDRQTRRFSGDESDAISRANLAT